MILEGVVTNVTNFGAFVDVGVHQDGLVHISAMSSRFVKDPHEVVKAGDIVKVKVLEVDATRRRPSPRRAGRGRRDGRRAQARVAATLTAGAGRVASARAHRACNCATAPSSLVRPSGADPSLTRCRAALPAIRNNALPISSAGTTTSMIE